MISIEATYTLHPIKAQVVYNIQEKSLDTFPCLNSDILLTVSYINIGFDSESMNANQIWGYSPKESWIKRRLESPPFSILNTIKIATDLDPGNWRLDSDALWKSYYDFETKQLCIGNPNFSTDDICVLFLNNAACVLNRFGVLKSVRIYFEQ